MTDSVVGIWLVNLLSRQPHSMCTVRTNIVLEVVHVLHGFCVCGEVLTVLC